jgi:hypothetical protein
LFFDEAINRSKEMMMHPYLIQRLVEDRQLRLRQEARRQSALRSLRLRKKADRPNPVRARLSGAASSRIGRSASKVSVVIALAFLLGSACGTNDEGTRTSSNPSRYDTGSSQDNTRSDRPALTNTEDEDNSQEDVLHLLVQRSNSQLGSSMECYTVYPDGSIELRHSGSHELSDLGRVSGSEIRWDSGRLSSFQWDGQYYGIDGSQATVINSCLN